jgi:cytosine/adenosine deaminase-related metal-dependent hydrolase
MMQMMLELQEGPASLSLPAILTMAALNGARALQFDHITGSIEPGKAPGLSIIEGADIAGVRLLPGSRLRRLL